MRSLIVCLMLLLVRATTLSAQYEDGPVRLHVPAGFEGPQVQASSPEMKMVAWVRPIPGTERGTLLQITIVDADAAGLSVPRLGPARAAEALVDEFLPACNGAATATKSSAAAASSFRGFPPRAANGGASAAGAACTARSTA